MAIGSFVAGMALSSAAYSHEVVNRVRPLKDFFLTLFFVLLGLQVQFTEIGSQYAMMAYLFAGAFLVKPVITFFLLKCFKYNNYTAFLTSLHLAQLGEFGLILVASGVITGALSLGFLTGAVLVTILTMILSASIIKHDRKVYELVRGMLAPIDKLFGTHPEDFRNVPDLYKPEVVIFGITPVTAEIIELVQKERKLLVVDFNPMQAIKYENRGIPIICSDAIDIDLYETIDFSGVDVVISVIHDTTDSIHGPSSNTYLIKKIREVSEKAVIVVTAQSEGQGERFYQAGATIVLTPNILGKRILKELMEERDPAKLRGMGLIYYEELHNDREYAPR